MLTFKQLENLLNINENAFYFKDYLKNFCSPECHNKKVGIYTNSYEDLLANFCQDCLKTTNWEVRPLTAQEIFVLKILVDKS